MTGVGEVLETARRARGWTQEDLAERAGVTQAALSRYEHDLRMPEPDVQERLAQALGVTVALLHHAGRMEGGLAVNAHMRRRKTARPTVWRELEARLNMARLHASQLYEEVSMRADRRVPTMDPDTTSPVLAARAVRAQWRMPLGPVRSLVGWMESAGVLVFESDFGSSARVDGMSQWSGDYPVIMLNSSAPTDRKRWTLAHELGHLVLHTEYLDDDAEQQADQFAAEFLMPAEEIKPYLVRLQLGRLTDLKRMWGVSMAAIVERAVGLGVMTAQQRTSFYKMMSARGLRYHEPASDELAPEVPRLAKHIGESLTARGLTAEEVARLAGFASPADNSLFLRPEHGLERAGLRLV